MNFKKGAVFTAGVAHFSASTPSSPRTISLSSARVKPPLPPLSNFENTSSNFSGTNLPSVSKISLQGGSRRWREGVLVVSRCKERRRRRRRRRRRCVHPTLSPVTPVLGLMRVFQFDRKQRVRDPGIARPVRESAVAAAGSGADLRSKVLIIDNVQTQGFS